ncbi:HD domain-containing protein, partial [Staphylococcus aureus]|nr:HD domain-containing protein [Staphylococcus aureus]
MKEIVDGLTKVDRVHFPDAKAAKSATYQKLIIAAAGRPEAITVKLCDRLHNMRSIMATSPEKQSRVALE